MRSTQVLEKWIADYLIHSESTLSLNLDDPFALFDEPKSQANQRAADQSRRQFSLDSANRVTDSIIKQQVNSEYPSFVEDLAASGQTPTQPYQKGKSLKDFLLEVGLFIVLILGVYIKLKYPVEE